MGPALSEHCWVTLYFSAIAGKPKPFNTKLLCGDANANSTHPGACMRVLWYGATTARVPVPAGCPVPLVARVVVPIDTKTLWGGKRDIKLQNTWLHYESCSAFEFVPLSPFPFNNHLLILSFLQFLLPVSSAVLMPKLTHSHSWDGNPKHFVMSGQNMAGREELVKMRQQEIMSASSKCC